MPGKDEAGRAAMLTKGAAAAKQRARQRELVDEYQRSRSDESFAELAKSFDFMLQGLASHVANRGSQEWDDAMQEARWQLHLCAMKFDPRIATLSTYVYRSVWGRLTSWKKEQQIVRVPRSAQDQGVEAPPVSRSSGTLVFDRVADESACPLRHAENLEELLRLVNRYRRRAGKRLSVTDRWILAKRCEGVAVSQIARELGITKSAVHLRVAKSVERLSAKRYKPSASSLVERPAASKPFVDVPTKLERYIRDHLAHVGLDESEVEL